jgi:hypothetical protein
MDQEEKEKLKLYESSEHQSANVLTDISFQVAKVSLITWRLQMQYVAPLAALVSFPKLFLLSGSICGVPRCGS